MNEKEFKEYKSKNPFKTEKDQKKVAKKVLPPIITTNVTTIINGFLGDPDWDQISDIDKEKIMLSVFQEIISQRRKSLKKRYKESKK